MSIKYPMGKPNMLFINTSTFTSFSKDNIFYGMSWAKHSLKAG